MEHEGDGDTNCNLCTRYRGIGTRTGGLENKGTTGDHPDFSIMKIG